MVLVVGDGTASSDGVDDLGLLHAEEGAPEAVLGRFVLKMGDVLDLALEEVLIDDEVENDCDIGRPVLLKLLPGEMVETRFDRVSEFPSST